MNTLKPAVFAIATALASAFAPMPDESTIIDATIGKEGVRTQRQVIDSVMADSRQYFGL